MAIEKCEETQLIHGLETENAQFRLRIYLDLFTHSELCSMLVEFLALSGLSERNELLPSATHRARASLFRDRPELEMERVFTCCCRPPY